VELVLADGNILTIPQSQFTQKFIAGLPV